VRSSLALLLRASSWRPAGCLTVVSSRGTRANSASRSADVETRRTSAAPRLFRRKILRRPRSGWKRRFFGSARRQKLSPRESRIVGEAKQRERRRESAEKSSKRYRKGRYEDATDPDGPRSARHGRSPSIFTERAYGRLGALHHPCANPELRAFAFTLSRTPDTATLRIPIARRVRGQHWRDKIRNSLLDNSVYRLTYCRSRGVSPYKASSPLSALGLFRFL